MRALKDNLYFFKVWWRKATSYPAVVLKDEGAGSYDEYWRNKRKGNIAALSVWQRERTEIAYAAMEKSPGTVIGDIGAGAGAVARYLVDRIPGSQAIAYDLSPAALEAAAELGLKAVPLDTRNSADLAKLEPVDYNLLFEIIEHVPHSELLVNAAFASARKGVFISIPNTGFFIYRLRLMFLGKVPMQWTVSPDEHLRYWTKTDLRWWLRALGYTGTQIKGYRGIPVLNYIWPNLFAAGLVAFIPRTNARL